MRTFSNILERTLTYYTPEDGEAFDIVVFPKVFTNISLNFWKSCLLGCGVGARNIKVKRLPLRGRLKKVQGGIRIVILASSLQDWLEHYNPDSQKSVQEIIDALRKQDKRYAKELKILSISRGMKVSGNKQLKI